MSEWSISDRLRRGLARAEAVVVLTGAGVSAESGLATFRGPGGLWEGRDPLELATPQAFRDDPETVWRFYDWRRRQAARAQPNAAHRALAAWERKRPSLQVVTQNVDGLHERAGSRRVLRLHGTLWRLRCTAEGTEQECFDTNLGELPPRCACGALLRPAVVWFGEPLPQRVLGQAAQAVRGAELVVVAGTSGLVYPAAGLPIEARRAGATVIEVNPERTPLSAEVDEYLAGPAGSVVPALARAAGAEIPSS